MIGYEYVQGGRYSMMVIDAPVVVMESLGAGLACIFTEPSSNPGCNALSLFIGRQEGTDEVTQLFQRNRRVLYKATDTTSTLKNCVISKSVMSVGRTLRPRN